MLKISLVMFLSISAAYGGNIAVSDSQLDNLISAMRIVESNGVSSAIGRDGERGELQMKQCVIDDVNRIYKTKYKIQDALSSETAKEICKKYLLYWGSKKKTGLTPTVEIYARIWNGGPRGYQKEPTIKYWNKTRKVMYGN